MHITIAYSQKQMILSLFLLLLLHVVATLFVGAGGLPLLTRTGVGALELVGNLISPFHEKWWNWLDPTYPLCF